jgi:hypothetical protein
MQEEGRGIFKPVGFGKRRVDPCMAMQVVFGLVVFVVAAGLVYLAATLGTAQSRFEALQRDMDEEDGY